MKKDYYEILGVSKSATPDEIKKAFYRVAQQHHPDKPGGDEVKFKSANEAYQVLSDAQKRAQYDQFGTADGPQFGGHGGGNPFGGAGFGGFDFSQFTNGNGGFEFQFGGGEGLDDILQQFMGFGGGRQRTPRGRSVEAEIKLSFREAIEGGEHTIEIPEYRDGKKTGTKKVKLTIPPGVDNGMQLKVPEYGETLSNGKTGDLLVYVRVQKHPHLQRDGMNLVMELSVKLSTALLGGEEIIESYDGTKIKIPIPAGLQIGQVLRIRGRGIPTRRGSGDLLIVTKIIIPTKLSRDAKKAVGVLAEEGI